MRRFLEFVGWKGGLRCSSFIQWQLVEHSFLPMRFSCWTSLAVVLAVFLGFYEVSLHFCESDFAKLALFSLINCPWICINGPRVKEFAGELVSYGLKTCITRNSQPIAPRFHLRRFYLRFLYNSHKIFPRRRILLSKLLEASYVETIFFQLYK